jgi:hypothetical protein
VNAIFSQTHVQPTEQPPSLESAELVAVSARAAAAAEAAQAAVSAASDACEASHAAFTKAEHSDPKSDHGVKRPHSGGFRGKYTRKPKALKVEFRQILYAEGPQEAIASMMEEGVPENTARGWSTPEELAKPLPPDGKNRPGGGRKQAYTQSDLRPVYDKANERKHLVGRVSEAHVRRLLTQDLPPNLRFPEMKFSSRYIRQHANALGYGFGSTTPAKASDTKKDPEILRLELCEMFSDVFNWRLEYFKKHHPGQPLSLEPMCTGPISYYFDELGNPLEASEGDLMHTMFKLDETEEEGQLEPGKSGSGAWRRFYSLGLLTNAIGGVELFLAVFHGVLQLPAGLITIDGHLIFVAFNDTHYNNGPIYAEFLKVALALIVAQHGPCGCEDKDCKRYCWIDDNCSSKDSCDLGMLGEGLLMMPSQFMRSRRWKSSLRNMDSCMSLVRTPRSQP